MKFLKTLAACAVVLAFTVGPVMAAEQTCCEKANAEGKECAHKCCITAHKEGKSCAKCNPNKEDEKFLKKDDKSSSTNAPAKK